MLVNKHFLLFLNNRLKGLSSWGTYDLGLNGKGLVDALNKALRNSPFTGLVRIGCPTQCVLMIHDLPEVTSIGECNTILSAYTGGYIDG